MTKLRYQATKKISVLLLTCLLVSQICLSLGAFAQTDNSGGRPSAQEARRPLNYRIIPGVTQDEVDAIDALRASGRSFSYGSVTSTESFLDNNGEIAGYTADLCVLLSQLFEIEFTPSLHDWGDIVSGLAENRIDFSGDFSITPERSGLYFMSEPIAVRSLALFHPADSSFADIAAQRTPILGFVESSVHRDKLAAAYDGVFEAVYFARMAEAAPALEEGRIDAFVSNTVSQTEFEDYDHIVCENFSPFVSDAVALTTQSPELQVIISVFDKYIRHGGRAELSALYEKGMTTYAGHVLYNSFGDEEKAYINRRIAADEKIPIILESGNYPISFYNERSGTYEGIVPDMLVQITLLTGLQFEVVNNTTDSWSTVLAMLQNGEAAIISELLHTPAREGLFLWPDHPSSITNYALLSKSDTPSLEVYQMLGQRIGVEIGTAYQDVASHWFPDVELLLYDSVDLAFAALDKGEIDLIMASENLLLHQTNYNEKPGYKISFAIDYTAESKPGFHSNETVLLSICNKTFPFIENDAIVRDWTSRTFDYSSSLAQARINILLISAISLVAFAGLLIVFLVKNNSNRRDLATLVHERTAQLEEKTAALSTVYNAIPDMLFSRDLQGRYISCNHSFASFANLSEENIIGKGTAEVLANMDKDELALYIQQDDEVMSSDKTFVNEHWITYPNGEKRLLETVKTATKQGGAVVGMMSISRDITAHNEAQEAALAASKAKSSFLARMSHEIRTPLNAIVGMAEITKASVGDTEKTISSVNQIVTSSYHLLGLINDVLDMSKIESGNLEILSQPFHLHTALEEMLAIISSRYMEKHISFEDNVREFSEISVVGDKLRLNQVLINLLSNAIKFTATHGKIKFGVNIVNETQEAITIQFAIEDNGIGMTEEQMSRLFKPFEQADSSIAAVFGGTGLGLSISQNLVQGMGGSIAVESALGVGSRFSFTLSFPKGEVTEQPAQVPAQMLNLAGIHILLAEDIEINRFIIEELLSPTGVTISMAENGREAIEMFESSEPGYYQLIFTDIQMPEMNGYEVAAYIRSLARPDAKTVPIIAMTANAYTEDVERALAAGMNRHIGKPINVDVLMQTLAIYLGNTAGDNGTNPFTP